MTLGERIQRLRKEQGLSQEQLAERVGVSRQAVSKWEVDAAVPETDKLLTLSRALGVGTDVLLGNDPPPPLSPPRGDSVGWLLHLLRTRGYRAGYLLMGWGGLVLVVAALVAFGWYHSIIGPLRAFGVSLSELPVTFLVPAAALAMIVLVALSAVIGGIVVVARGRRAG